MVSVPPPAQRATRQEPPTSPRSIPRAAIGEGEARTGALNSLTADARGAPVHYRRAGIAAERSCHPGLSPEFGPIPAGVPNSGTPVRVYSIPSGAQPRLSSTAAVSSADPTTPTPCPTPTSLRRILKLAGHDNDHGRGLAIRRPTGLAGPSMASATARRHARAGSAADLTARRGSVDAYDIEAVQTRRLRRNGGHPRPGPGKSMMGPPKKREWQQPGRVQIFLVDCRHHLRSMTSNTAGSPTVPGRRPIVEIAHRRHQRVIRRPFADQVL